MRQRHGRRGLPEPRFRDRVVLDVPVLMVDAVILSNVELHQPERTVVAHSGEQVRVRGGPRFVCDDTLPRAGRDELGCLLFSS
jgi:hypothetical protein